MLKLFFELIGKLPFLAKFLLKKSGYKIVKIDDFETIEEEVKFNYPNVNPECLKMKENGHSFGWSNTMPVGYERYYEINGQAKLCFKCHTEKLWIKRSDK